MRAALHTTFAASKKESLAEMVDRIRQAFLDAGMPGVTIRFTFIDSALTKRVSPVKRVLKRHPEMERFLVANSPLPQLSNAATGESAEYSMIQAIVAGVPRSYPFSGVGMHFHEPAFGEALRGLPKIGRSLPGVMVTDNRWVNGRQRALSVYRVYEVEDQSKKLPPDPEPVAAVMKALGKARKTEQVPLLVPGGGVTPSIPPANAEAVKVIVADYRSRLKEIVARAGMPHHLPSAAEIRLQNSGVTAGSRKPVLQSAFKPMGYGCRGGSGEFHLTRRTSGNLTVELYLDVGTWSHEVSAVFLVQGAGFKASLGIPVAEDISLGQYPIGDASQWQKIVENLAAMIRELDRSFVPEIEQAAGPSPEWYQPPS